MATVESSCKRSRIRTTLSIEFATQAEKSAFNRRLESVKLSLAPNGSRSIDNYSMMNTMFDLVERSFPRPPNSDPPLVSRSFNCNHGVYTGNASESDESMFLTERVCLEDLLEGLSSSCPCGRTISPWIVSSVVQKGHVARILFACKRCGQEKRTWSSSRILSGRYVVNQKMVHSFTCAGILPTQYIKLCNFSRIGTVGQRYIRKVYNIGGYTDLVGRMAEECLEKAVEEVKGLPQYTSYGEWVITDARHDSTANAFHTTVPCLSGNTHKILGISTISRNDHGIAQTRELVCTQVVIPQVISRGLKIVEVAHDIQQQVSNYITKDLKLINSFDTWHGTKNVAKCIKKISEGKVSDQGKTWYSELRDKRRSIKLHLYWAMKRCDGDHEKLRQLIDSIPQHYQGFHSSCHPSSPCHLTNYAPSKELISRPGAIKCLEKQLHDAFIYKKAESFCRCRDTYWVESFNHQLLMYLPKRIHFGTRAFTMRMNLAVMDWNENVDRPYTSTHTVKDLRRPDRRTPLKVLVDKSFDFVDQIWTRYVTSNMTDLRPLFDQVDEDAPLLIQSEPDDLDGEFAFEYDDSDDEEIEFELDI